ncbi:PadR family transcriptional regulator [Thalassorhabdus alkalitolerans]|uniref:PadR family transcriptional regulator n=1 Tax=Thalassorhabdus alkalitolerans TaxID=2282697 RepID=A0ABW0YPG0_9BACI
MLRDFFLGTIKIHRLYHASKEPIYGSYMIEELKNHGYDMSSRTIYPTLHQLEEKVVCGRIRMYYTTTESGNNLLRAWRQIRELAEEVLYENKE